MVKLDSVVNAATDVVSQRVDDTLVLLHVSNGQYYTLNEIGGSVWTLCDGTHSVAEIVASICQEYDAPEPTITSDVLELLDDLEGEGLVMTPA